MKYNEKYGRWFTKGGLVYRYSKAQDKLVLCKQCSNVGGYKVCHDCKQKPFIVHRAIYETFVSEIPKGYQIDHINTIRDDNRLENLRAVTPKENKNNPLTKQHSSEAQKGKKITEEQKKKISKTITNKSTSEFGIKYFKHFGITKYEKPNQYAREQQWFYRHGKCRWEVK